MKHPPKDHRRLVCDTAALLQTTYHSIFYLALAVGDKLNDQEIQVAKAMAQNLLDRFVETGFTVDYVENFCLDVLIGKLPFMDNRGKVLNPPKRKQLPGGTHGKQ